MPDIAIAPLSTRLSELGEGASYDPQTDSLFWFDILNGLLLQHPLNGRETIVHRIGQMASAVAAIDPARQLVLTETGFFIRDRLTGSLSLHTPLEADNPATRSNDARVHPSGALWAGTMGKNAETGAGAIYWFRKGELRKLFDRISIPNSICFSPDGTAAFYVDTAVGDLMRVACDPSTGLPSGEPKLFARLDGPGGFDGSIVDADGTLWNARWGEARLVSYAPNGEFLSQIALPASQVTCPAFIGTKADRLAVTSAFVGLAPDQRLKEPQAGATFRLDLPVKGRHEPSVLLS
jgi:sugar lactone lactonase YvrE